jgi:peptide/nickel transport system substrate-binding protein
VEGFSLPEKRSDRVVLEANLDYWDKTRFPRLRRIVFDNTMSQRDAVEAVKNGQGRVDLVTGLRPVETMRVAQSPFAAVVKNRGAAGPLFGRFNMRKTGSPWTDVRLRQAVNLAINRADLVRYAANGNGVIIPALVPPGGFGYDPGLKPYPFDPAAARERLREAGYPNGLPILLIAPEAFRVQTTVVSKMLEQAGFQVQYQILDPSTYNKKTDLSQLDRPAEQQPWDIALYSDFDWSTIPAQLHRRLTGSGGGAWSTETTEIRQLYDLLLRTVDRDRQQDLIRQMERRTHDQAYLVFLYNPIPLYAVNKAVAFVPYSDGWLRLAETSVTDQHWSVRKAGNP